MTRTKLPPLWTLVQAAGAAGRWISDDRDRVVLRDLAARSCLEHPRHALQGRSVLIKSERQLPAVLAAIELDGIAERILLCPPDLDSAHLPDVIAEAHVQVVVSNPSGSEAARLPHVDYLSCSTDLCDRSPEPDAQPVETEWVLFTSGTTGRPKMVAHTLASLIGPLNDGLAVSRDAVWSTFYDVRRYGGLQILMRALIGGGSMVLSSAHESVHAFLTRAGASGVTHISGTPSHWRGALMSQSARQIQPAYVRLSGEVADQAILDQLKACFPSANVAHAFASTEAGVAFDVRDGRAGFPASLIDGAQGAVEMLIIDGSLRIRSNRLATRIIGNSSPPLRDDAGFIDTGDMVERQGDRYYFMGRREGTINVGGLKVYPEEVEAVINRHPDVRMSYVWPRRSPITGAIVAADVVLQPAAAGVQADFGLIRDAILAECRATLAAHKVPVTIRQVASLATTASGKLARART